MPPKIIVLGGSFNPPTLAHIRLMLSALDQVGADRGIFAPSNNEYVSRKMKRSGTPSEVLTEALRLKMLQRRCPPFGGYLRIYPRNKGIYLRNDAFDTG